MKSVESLATKQKQLIGVGASIAAGCQPCTLSFAKGARESGACERGLRFAVTCGLAVRESATAGMSAFAVDSLPHPDVDQAFRAERGLLEALIGVAACMSSNTASLVSTMVERAREQGATDDQLRIAAETGRIAKRGAERSAEAAFGSALGATLGVEAPSCACADSAPQSDGFSRCGCGETVREEKRAPSCDACGH